MIGLWRFYRGGAEGDWGKRGFGEEGIRELGKSCMMAMPSRASGTAIIHLAEDPENTGIAELLSRRKFEWLKC
jgi:hypothetical protein